MKLKWVFVTGLSILVFFIWTTDQITLQGERTVYTVECSGGTWDGNRCSGELVAGPRFRYRALKGHGEVLFWVLGVAEPSAKLTACTVRDGRNWACPPSPDAPRSITLAISQGDPVRNAAWPTRPFHAVSKVTWMLLRLGVKLTNSAD